MTDRRISRWPLAAGMLCGLVAFPVVADYDKTESSIAKVLAEMPEEVRIYNDHLVTLASPFMGGRLPGSRGMEIAKEYMEYYFRDAGLEPAFEATTETEDGETISAGPSYRQAFPLGGSMTVTESSLSMGDQEFVHERDFVVTSLGGSGDVTGPVTFVGYSISEGEDGYSSYGEGDDLAGKIAMMMRFEPMDAEGKSQWADGRWSRHAGFATKLRAAAARNPDAIIVVNTPGADDPRVDRLDAPGGSARRGRGAPDVPVLMMTPEAASRLVGAGENGMPSLLQLRRLADMGRTVIDFHSPVTINAKLERKSIGAENIGGLLPGRGDLADELIVVGAHLDHLGMGYFGSRSGPGELHPGADDNASGAAGLLIFADQLAQSYAELDDDDEARSVLFVAFSGEESGLNGSRYYVENPIRPLDKHHFMVNFDMIGRIEDGKLTCAGTDTAEGMKEWIEPFLEASPLDVKDPGRSPGGSDHLPFLQPQIPALFGIITTLHADYHTPADTSDKINRVGAVETIDLFHDIVYAGAQLPTQFVYKEQSGGSRRGGGGGGPSIGDIKVRFGIMPASYNEDELGIGISEVTPGGSADEAGVKAGDRLIRWDGKKLSDVMSWMQELAKHKPGDKVKIGVMRDGEEVTLEVTLQER